ncbi:hypothetical protein M422DRAFT_28736 [Sphaerobolus stellatus SS14]|nr:hypothetical protein M422DRAFT_28736 [Sphaerobolus stellatus SS14]
MGWGRGLSVSRPSPSLLGHTISFHGFRIPNPNPASVATPTSIFRGFLLLAVAKPVAKPCTALAVH